MNYQFISIDRIFSILGREGVDFAEEDVIEMTGEALEFIGTQRILEDAIAFYEVKNNQCPVPPLNVEILQIGKNINWTPDNPCVTPATVIEAVPNIVYQNCSTCGTSPTGVDMGYVVLDGKGSPLVEYDIAYYRPYFDLLGEYYGWSNSSYYRGNYIPVRKATSTFFNSVVDSNYDKALYDTCKDEYTVIRGQVLRFSFSTGFVAIAHKRAVTDPVSGYPLVPDSVSHIRAIVSYIKYRKADNEFESQREGSSTKLGKREQDWQWYCGQASNQDKMPQGIDEYQNLLDQRSYLLPNLTRYYGYFGNLAMPEYRKYNDPDFRNNKSRIITGHG